VRRSNDKLSLMHKVELASRLPLHHNIARYEACHRFRVGDMEMDYGVLQY